MPPMSGIRTADFTSITVSRPFTNEQLIGSRLLNDPAADFYLRFLFASPQYRYDTSMTFVNRPADTLSITTST